MIGGSRGERGTAGRGERRTGAGPERGGLHGALVTETGLALVHEGELILPAAGSEAEVELARSDAGSEVHVHLPVVVEIVGRRDDAELERTVNETLRRLRLAVQAQPPAS